MDDFSQMQTPVKVMARTIPVDPVLERGYDVRKLRDDFEAFLEDFMSRSAEFRSNADCSLDCAYGGGEKDKLDIFRCGEKDAPLFAFIHGGYWQRGDKAIYSLVAEPFLAMRADVALIGYELCPSATMPSIVANIRNALAWLWRNAADCGISADRINVSGHSAGGHLTGMMLATQWMDVGDDLPHNLVKSGIPISGLYQLEPIRQTTSSDALHLDDESSAACSPQFLKPATDAPMLVTLGGAETPQFHWQSEQFVEEWARHGLKIDYHVEPDVDHFDVVTRLASTDSEIFRKTLAWLR